MEAAAGDLKPLTVNPPSLHPDLAHSSCCLLTVRLLPQQLSFALQAVQQLDLAVHVGDLVLQVLPGHVHLLAQLSEHTRQLPENHRQQGHEQGQRTEGLT